MDLTICIPETYGKLNDEQIWQLVLHLRRLAN